MNIMLNRIRKKIEAELASFARHIDKAYSLTRISPLLSKSIKDFMLRPGKRIRPILFVIGYLGFAKKEARGLYTSAIAIELLHDFMLVHDDIIDKSDLRRGKPSMHSLLNNHLKKYPDIKFNGQDLSIVVGDCMYAMAIHAFLSINEEKERKEKALRKFIEAALYTGGGEFIELLASTKELKKITKREIENIYDYKTSFYTFACPLASGAILAAADKRDVNNLFQIGMYLGRAFQIKDDILGMLGEEDKIGKSSLTDLQESKKTLLVWHAYNNVDKKQKALMESIFSKTKVDRQDLVNMRAIISDSGGLEFSKNEIFRLFSRACGLLNSSEIKPRFKRLLSSYAESLLRL